MNDLVSVHYTWADLMLNSKVLYVSRRLFTFLGYVFYSKPVKGILTVVETRDGYKMTHPALKRPVTVSALQHDSSPSYTSGIELYTEESKS